MFQCTNTDVFQNSGPLANRCVRMTSSTCAYTVHAVVVVKLFEMLLWGLSVLTQYSQMMCTAWRVLYHVSNIPASSSPGAAATPEARARAFFWMNLSSAKPPLAIPT